jgi:hypothetical protein
MAEPSRFRDPAARAALHTTIRRRAGRGHLVEWLPVVAAVVVVVLVAAATSDGTMAGLATRVAEIAWVAAVLVAVRLIIRSRRTTR